MAWGRIALAVVGSGVVSSLTDWLFMGDWLYKRYDRNPEIWRYSGGQGENKAILWSSLLPFVTCGVFVLLCGGLHLHSYRGTLKLALAIWLIGPLPADDCERSVAENCSGDCGVACFWLVG